MLVYVKLPSDSCNNLEKIPFVCFIAVFKFLMIKLDRITHIFYNLKMSSIEGQFMNPFELF